MRTHSHSLLCHVAFMAVLLTKSDAFSTPHVSKFVRHATPHSLTVARPPYLHPRSALQAANEDADDEIERLRSMAAKLRAEASALESEQQKVVAAAAEKAFQKFDTNQDGEISFEELKAGLEKEFKMELSEKRVKQLMEDFDKSGDGMLQKDEFVGVDVMRNRLDALARDEKALALEKAKEAQKEAEAVKFLQAQLDRINDKPPSGSDKILSCLPYLFPLLDGLQFAKFLVMENMDNPFAAAIAVIYALYRAVPFSGLLCFFALSFLSGNPSINRLIRFNMQQAIYLDIGLFFPGLIAALITLILPTSIPPSVAELGNDFLFFSLLATISYSVVSSLLGQEPNKLPFISQAVLNRIPTVDMFDAEGRLLPRNDREKKDKDNEKKD